MSDHTVIKSASIILQKTSGEILLCKRSDELKAFPGFWVFPGGKITENLPDDWEGTEYEVFETIFQELFEEVGIVIGNTKTINPENRNGSYFTHLQNEDLFKEFKSQMVFVGKKQTPPFSNTMFNAAYYWVQNEIIDTLDPQVDGSELVDMFWILPQEAIMKWKNKELRLPPPILHLIRDINNKYFVSKNLMETSLPIGFQTKIELAPGYQVIPFLSNTIFPFISTNLVVIESSKDILLVDPGAKVKEEERFTQFLLSLPYQPTVFITHHHRDHWEALGIVEKIYPKTSIIGHANTLSKISTKLKSNPITSSSLIVGNKELSLLDLPGHTDGHVGLYDPHEQIVIAGDHVVGFGSAVLDPEYGNMKQYFNSCYELLELEIYMIIPAHGPPNYNPHKLIKEYIHHRQSREDSILESYKKGNTTLDEIVSDVYQDVPEHMWEYAKHNIRLHLEKLQEENKV